MKKSHENILIYDFSYKNLIGTKPLCIGFYKIDGFIRIYDGTRCLILFDSEKYNATYNRIRYLINICFFSLLRKLKFVLMILYLQEKHWLCIML